MTETTQFEKLSEINEQNIMNIKALEQQEQSLFSELTSMDKTPDEKKKLMVRINELSQIRSNLYQNSRDLFSFYTINVNDARSTLAQELNAIKILETELNEAKKRYNSIQDQKNDKLRLVQINTYYGKRYSAQKDIMKTIFYTCALVFVLLLIQNIFGIIPSSIFTTLIGIILTIGIVMVVYKIIDVSNRDNMNFDEYNWQFDKKNAPLNINRDPSAKVPWTFGITCVGPQCCDANSEFNSEKNICEPKKPTTIEDKANVEKFTGMCQYAMSAPNAVVRLFGNQVVPMESSPNKMDNYASF
jgi:hypothetical protein